MRSARGGVRPNIHWLAIVGIPALLVVFWPAVKVVSEYQALRSTALLPQTAQVTLPPAAASPRQVVSAYLRALNAHDAQTAQALVKKGDPSENGSVRSWLEHATSITRVRFEQVQRGPGVTEVALTFNLQLNIDPPDMGFSRNGTTYWFIILNHDASSGRWLITSEGSGP